MIIYILAAQIHMKYVSKQICI